jgi:hypothetical protein
MFQPLAVKEIPAALEQYVRGARESSNRAK